MSDAIYVKVVRPYDSIESYLDGDAWTVERTGMLLIDTRPVAAGTTIRFLIVLQTGQTIMRGEGTAGEVTPGAGALPGGLRVRFKRFDSQTKTILKQALERQKPRDAAPEVPSGPQPRATTPSDARGGGVPSHDAGRVGVAPSTGSGEPAASPAEKSGIRHRPQGRVVAPPNREELLERLRRRLRDAHASDDSAAARAG